MTTRKKVTSKNFLLPFLSLFSTSSTSVVMEADNLHLTAGVQYARNHNYNKAEIEFDLLLSFNRTHALGFYYRGCTRLHLNKFELAVEDFDSAISSLHLPPGYELQALYKRGFAHQKLHKLDLALDDYRLFLNRAKENDKNDFIHKAHFSIGSMYAALNQNEQAIRHFNNAIKTSGNSIEDKQKIYYLHRGRAYAFCADFGAARDDLCTVIQESNDDFLKGCAYNELGEHDKALKEFNLCLKTGLKNNESSLSIETFDDHVRFRRGLSYACLNLHDSGIADYQHILDKPNRASTSTIADRTFFRKGMSSIALNDTYDALINFNKSILLNNRQRDVFYARGMLHFTLGRHEAAVYDHRRALELGESKPLLSSIYQTFYNTHNHDHEEISPHISLQKKLREAEAALKYCKEQGSSPEEQHRRIAEYKQQLAPYTNDPETAHHSAREHIQKACSSSVTMKTYHNIALDINDLYAAQILCKKYPGGIASERIVNQFVTSTMGGILKLSEVLEECTMKNNWEDLLNALYELDDISDVKSSNHFILFRSKFVRIQLGKVKLMQTTSEKFKNSPSQQEFYKLLMIRLCNLFDATRAATTGIFQHALTGTFTKVSYVPKLLGYLCQFLPVGAEATKNVFGICETGSKKLDEIRIQNALIHIGCLDDQKKLNEAANNIAEKLTIMYERQIQRFPTVQDDPNIIKKNKENEVCSCVKCYQWCCTCFEKSKNRILNEREASNIMSIVQYAFELFVNSITKFEVSEVNNIADLNDFFVNSICDLAHWSKIYDRIVSVKIQPKDALKDSDHWTTYEFFRRPGIRFGEKDIRVDKHMDIKKFGYREPTWKEVGLYKNEQGELDRLGFKNINES